MPGMKLRSLLLWLGGAALVALAYRSYGWPGVALVSGGLVFWLLLHFNRVLQALRRAAQRPIGHVDSAVMLNARLKPGVTLLHVLALTRSLGTLQSAKDEQPEIFCWTDAGGARVRCEFRNGKLVRHALERPGPELATAQATPAPALVAPVANPAATADTAL